MSLLHAILMAILQGATELFPVSSLGHSVIIPALLGWQVDQTVFLPFLVILHLGTGVALLLYFWRDWWALGVGVIGLSGGHISRESRHILRLIIIATLPAVVLAALFEHRIRGFFASALLACVFLAANGLLLLLGEKLRGDVAAKGVTRPIATMGLLDALVIGVFQCTALIPGISRSGATMVGGLLRGIDHEGAARFSFLIATPIILGANAKEIPKLLHGPIPHGFLSLALGCAVLAGVVAYASTAFLMAYFKDHDNWALKPFAYYCLVAGVFSAGVLYLA